MLGENSATILVAGGYGVVGSQICRILAEGFPGVRVVVGGRDQQKAAELSGQLPNAGTYFFDLGEDKDPLSNFPEPLSAVVTAVNDKESRLMRSCISQSIPFVDITRWTDRVRSGVIEAALANLQSPVVFASSWMAGIPALIASHEAATFERIETINTDIRYSLADQAGPDSVEYVDRLAAPFPVLENGVWKEMSGLSDPKPARFFGGSEGVCYRFDTPDHLTLPAVTGASSVATRITYDDQSTMDLMARLVTSGIWSKLQAEEFDSFRNSLLYNPGEGAPHEVTVTIHGTLKHGQEIRRQIFLRDAVSQTHLTALGAVLHVTHTIGLDGSEPRTGGIFFAERHRDPAGAVSFLESHDIDVRVEDIPVSDVGATELHTSGYAC
ncbi:hypothetical protein [Ruegeria atlantica]|uniref:hypothetical protein n=1 Tax=Ruegeria atlantica TaxID=81569 RepID=UPI00147EB984|nr:hypothetical protein [Ruegeria atlantica]